MKKDLTARLLALLGQPKYQPLDKVELTRKLGLSSDDRSGLRGVLRKLELAGEIVRIRKDRYVLPATADLRTGLLQVHQNGSAHLVCESGEELYVAAQDTWTALHGDRVVARVMHEGVQQPRGMRAGQQPGRVIRILERKHTHIVGTLQRSERFHYVIPDDPRMVHDVYVPAGGHTLPRPPRVGEKVVVRLAEWTSRHVNPEGEIVEILGAATEPGVAMLSIIRKHHLPTEFPDKVLREVDGISDEVGPRELAGRVDMRSTMIVTIDPDDAKDFDDAIHVERTAHGWKLGVHIADVSHYVRAGTALDREAYRRGNSVYLVDRVLPMLPEKLSNGLCSLKPQVDRLTLAAFIEFNDKAKVTSVRFAEAVIRSARRLTYKEAFAILQKPPGDDPVAVRLHTAWELASQLRQKRFAAGSLDLDFPEVKVWLDAEGRPVRMEKVENDISHQLIEEFMLVANEVVARHLKNRLVPSLYRIHEQPDPDRLAEFRELAISYGIKIGDLTIRTEVQKLLRAIRGRPEEHALKLGFLKSLKRAEYSPKPLGHYGLAKNDYTHFTSPIRRYADLVVHRVMRQLITRARPAPAAPADLAHAAEHISTTERTAAEAEKESVKLKKLEFFQQQLRARKPEAFEAAVIDVRSYGLLVELPDYLLTGLIHVSALPGDFYTFDAARLRYIGRKTKRIYKVGDRFPVIVARVDAHKQQVDFAPAV